MSTPIKYTEVKVIKLTKIQSDTLKKLAKYNIRVCDFIRDAIAEKLERDKHKILKTKKEYTPF
tara:strand:+ start:34 stop:222 length:189 start_codon:yes stop_codon:yes gene_type:complete